MILYRRHSNKNKKYQIICIHLLNKKIDYQMRVEYELIDFIDVYGHERLIKSRTKPILLRNCD